ncbi:MAG: DISARM anti-phage system protein DrmE domain-containing protein [Sulfobacillus sp.]
MNSTMLAGWIDDALAALPGTDDALFQKLWKERRLMFDGRPGVGDTVDYYSACLVAAALRRGERLLVTLPDFQPHRPAFLFATALIRHFLDSRSPVGAKMPRMGPVLYFGPTVGIREQLRNTSVSGLGLNLAEVFSQQDVSRGATNVGRARSISHLAPEGLPRVVTIYSPADAGAVVRTYKPCWIAVDCGDAAPLIWLQPLLEEASRQRIPVIAWGQNPLSECVADFVSYGQTFTWPPTIQPLGCFPRTLNGDPHTLLLAADSICLSPSVLQGGAIGAFSASLRDAGQLLARTVQHLSGRFGQDAVAVHWNYFRSLETLAVPVNFYEAEARQFWGLQSFGKLSDACDHFRAACTHSDPRLYHDLEEIAALLSKAKQNLEHHGCALWDTLTNLCIEDPIIDEARILVFASDSRKRLFLFAMLARHNITEDDLRGMRTYVLSLRELRRWVHACHISSQAGDKDDIFMPSEEAIWHPVLVGLPSPTMTSRLLCTFLYPKVDIILYPHQCASLKRRQANWSMRLDGDKSGNVNTLARLSGLLMPHVLPTTPARIVMDEPMELNGETTANTKTSAPGPGWLPADAVSEVARIFQSDDESTAKELVISDHPAVDAGATADTSEDILCDEAVKVQFDQGWHAYFAQDDVINVVKDSLDLRYVRSLRVNERVVLIHGQQRQSLYDLIISRVHKHPSIELHLAMIRRWQDDLRLAFEQWRKHTGDSTERRVDGPRDLNGLLRRMQAQGSQLVSSLTLTFWLRGFVLCPLDPEDLRRVAEVLDMAFVRQHYKRIGQAANRLRGLHRGLSLKLKRWLQDHATGAVHKSDDDVIDAELGLTFGDVQNSLLVLRVVSIEHVIGPFLRINLGRAEKDT